MSERKLIGIIETNNEYGISIRTQAEESHLQHLLFPRGSLGFQDLPEGTMVELIYYVSDSHGLWFYAPLRD